MSDGAYRAYHNLIMAQWQMEDGTLPSDDAALAKLSGLFRRWKKFRDEVLQNFSRVENRLINQVQKEEWDKAREISEKKARKHPESGQSVDAEWTDTGQSETTQRTHAQARTITTTTTGTTTEEQNQKQNLSAKKTSRGKREKIVDPRRRDFIEDLQRHWDGFAKTKFVFTATDGTQVDLFLKTWSHMTREEWRNCLRNRRNSRGVISTQRLHIWLPKLGNYLNGVLDEYGHPLNGAGGKNGSVPVGKTQTNMGVLAESLARGKRESPSGENGLFSAGGTRGGDTRIIHELPASTGPASVPGGDGEFSGERKAGG